MSPESEEPQGMSEEWEQAHAEGRFSHTHTMQIQLRVCPKAELTRDYYILVREVPHIGDRIILNQETDREETFYVTDIDWPIVTDEEKPVGWQRGRPMVVARWRPRD